MTVLLGVSTMYAASAKSFNVSVKNTVEEEVAKSFALNVTTVETHSSMCGLQVTKLEITNPTMAFGIEILPIKTLNIEFQQNPQSMCLMAFGPHRGGIALDIGQSLPALNGVYNLVINDEEYGLLRVSREEGAVLEAPLGIE